MSRKKSAKFEGPLAEPIKVSLRSKDLASFGKPLTSEEVDELNSKEFSRSFFEELQKLPLLFKHYGIDPNPDSDPYGIRFMRLSLCLAEDFVPGFQISSSEKPNAAGRPKNWNFEKQLQLIADFQTSRRDGETQRQTLGQLLFTEPYSSRWSSDASRTARTNESREKAIRTLETRYIEAKRALRNAPAINRALTTTKMGAALLRSFACEE